MFVKQVSLSISLRIFDLELFFRLNSAVSNAPAELTRIERSCLHRSNSIANSDYLYLHNNPGEHGVPLDLSAFDAAFGTDYGAFI